MTTDTLSYIPVAADEVPYMITIKLGDRTYELTLHYNEEADLFTVDLALPDPQGVVLCRGVAVRYGTPLFEFWSDERYPWPVITPLCLTGEGIDTITRDNFGREVLLYLLPRE